MRTFAQKQHQPQKPASSSLARPNMVTFGPDHREQPFLHLQRTIGNQAVLRMLQTHAEELKGGLAGTASPRFGYDFSQIPLHPPVAGAVQTKLASNKPGDEYEQEADRAAEQVMRMPEPRLQRACACGGGCPKCQTEKLAQEHERLQTKHAGSGNQGQTAVPPVVHEVLRSPGQSLDPATRGFMESRFGHDFSWVRVHADGEAADGARAVQARAYTIGRDIVFGAGEYAPATEEGKRLLAHELTHVAQQRHTAAPDEVRRKIRPADVSSELVGQEFSLRKEFTDGVLTVAADEIVTVMSWVNAAETAEVSHPSLPGTLFNVPKHLLEPVQTKVAGVAPYGAGLAKVERDVESGAAKLEKFKKTQPQYKTEKAKRDFAKELSVDEAEQTRKVTALNVRLIQATMLNRFDASIKNWVDFYNDQFGFKGRDALDPNLIKAMVYKESQMGTFGDFMSDPATSLILTRFNILQAVDSWPEEQLLVIDEMMPSLIANHHLENIRKDLSKVQTELEGLNAKAGRRNEADNARRAELKAQSEPQDNWQVWFIAYPGFDAATTEFLNAVDSGKKHKDDYDFWIRVGIRAVFEKHKNVNSWEEAARAYNGAGPDARNYRDFVVRHKKGAVEAEKKGREFVPEKL